MKIGFTGTRDGMTNIQRNVLSRVFMDSQYGALLHGGCVGADEQAHEIAVRLGMDTIVYPGLNRKGLPANRGRYHKAGIIKDAKPYLDRNKDIVNDSDFLVATPGEMTEQLRSGTWSTVRYARSIGKQVIILYPDGTTEG